jgi:hypothetical protein
VGPVVGVGGAAEEAVRQAELERDDVRQREHRDLVPLWLSHGRIFAHVGFQATGPSEGTLRRFVP